MLVLVAWFLRINQSQWFPYNYVSTTGLVPAYKYTIDPMVSYMLVLVAWFLLINASFRLQRLTSSVFKNATRLKKNLDAEAFPKLKLRATLQEPRIKAGTLRHATKKKPWAWWTTTFKI